MAASTAALLALVSLAAGCTGESETDDTARRCLEPRLLAVPTPGEGTEAATGAPTSSTAVAGSAGAGAGATTVRVRLGDPVTVQGSRFAEGCVTEPVDTDAGSRPDDTEPKMAIDSVRLYVVQGPNKVSLAQVVPSGAEQGFESTVGIPEGLVAGPASIEAYGEDTQPLATAKVELLPR